jgi:hypothetical protein
MNNILKTDIVKRQFLSLLYGCGICNLKQSDNARLKTEETKFMSPTTEYNLLDRGRNEDILEELKVNPIENKLALCK